MNYRKIERGVRLILEGIGEDLHREGLQKTPQRFAEMCREVFAGIGCQPAMNPGFLESTERPGLIVIKDIDFYSVCEHHLLPFFGTVKIAYLAQNNRVAGFSDFSKIVDIYARRLQIQERLTTQIADAIMTTLQPKGVLVVIEATQLCASMRGPHKKGLKTLTETTRGELPLERLRHLESR